ncbi:MAG TPA: MgtC/SapB family protein [Thermoplasmata archaeon]|nr:MgtC/SapB family protein [Thermoplasmata archaeon]
MIDPSVAVLRLLIVFSLAFGIGLERQLRRKPVGFGTFIFVSTGACALAILSVDLESENPLPLLGGVITGIGFLGAGALIRSNDRVFGFTTAALVWAMAALGVAGGAGLYYLVFVNYAIVWAVVLTDRFLEGKGYGSHAKVVHMTIANPITAEDLDRLLPPGHAEFERVRIDKEVHLVSVTAQVRVRPREVEGLVEDLRRNDKIRSFEIE